MTRAFRFGVTNGAAADLESWGAAARRAESLGYSTFLLPDTTRTPAPLPTLAAAAAVTTTLHVGTWVLCDPLRNARMVAWEAGGLAQLSGGRFELGIGAGRPGAENDAADLGLGYGTPGERVDALADSIAVFRERIPDVPILVAASGPRLLRLAGSSADIVAFGWAPATDVDTARERIEIVRAAAGDRSDDLELAAGLIAVGDADQPWLARMGTDARTLIADGAITALGGSAREMADELERRREQLGLSYLTVPTSAMDDFAPVVELLAGR